MARGGTLFLDEIGDLPMESQVRLLRLLQEHTFERLGGDRSLHVDIRVVAATHRDLLALVDQGTFREDLYYRLNVLRLELPPLCDRRDDIPLLVAHFLERSARQQHHTLHRISPAALLHLQAHDWPGNVRELEHTIERAVVDCPGPLIQPSHITFDRRPMVHGHAATVFHPDELQREHLRSVLERTAWAVSGPRGAAALLGLPESTLRGQMIALGLQRPSRRRVR